jgi:hypothetical protein
MVNRHAGPVCLAAGSAHESAFDAPNFAHDRAIIRFVDTRIRIWQMNFRRN